MNNLQILYEDNHLLVVIKPINILSQSDHTKDIDMLTILKKYLKEKYQKPGNVYLGLVHRLDRPTGGIMVFARTSKAASRLSKQIKDGDFKKTYLAVVHGKTNKKDTLKNYLLKEKEQKTVAISNMDIAVTKSLNEDKTIEEVINSKKEEKAEKETKKVVKKKSTSKNKNSNYSKKNPKSGTKKTTKPRQKSQTTVKKTDK